jgi:hypothetical protein
MRIEGLPPDPGAVRNITDRKTQKPAPAETAKNSDTVEISGAGGAREPVDLSADLPIRTETIETVARRISSHEYDTPEMTEKVARRLMTLPSIARMVNAGTDSVPSADREEALRTAESRISSGYYDQPEVSRSVAGQMIDALGLSGFLGK